MKSITEIQSEIARLTPIIKCLWEEMEALEAPYNAKKIEWHQVYKKLDSLKLLLETITEDQPAECNKAG
jgi:hypothetical protein